MNIQRTLNVSGSRSFAITRAGAPRPSSRISPWRLIKDALPISDSPAVNAYRWKNLPNIWRGFWRIALAWMLSVPHVYGCLYAKVIRANGEVLDLGLISTRLVTDAGVQFIVDAFQNLKELENMKFHAFGTGTTAESAAQTALVTELTTQYATDNVRPTGSLTEGASANIFRTVATLTPDANVAVTEHAVLDQAANSGGVMLDRSMFAAINLSSGQGDSLQTTYDFTVPSGG